MDIGERLDRLGFSDESGMVRFLYEPSTEILVVQAWRKVEDRGQLKSLYVRHRSEEKYRRLTPQSPMLSYEDILIYPGTESIYVNVFESSFGEHAAAFDWHSLQEIDLKTGDVKSQIGECELRSADNQTNIWVAALVGVASKPQVFFAQVGIPDRESGKENYYLAELDYQQSRVNIITKLEAGFC